MKTKETITVETLVNASIEKVWTFWTKPEHITKWNAASDDWHTTRADNDLKIGGKFLSRMEAKDGSFGFDFVGIYDEIIPLKLIRYYLEDGRKVEVYFQEIDSNTTKVTEAFDPEPANSAEMQREGWYAILNNFHKYTENH